MPTREYQPIQTFLAFFPMLYDWCIEGNAVPKVIGD